MNARGKLDALFLFDVSALHCLHAKQINPPPRMKPSDVVHCGLVHSEIYSVTARKTTFSQEGILLGLSLQFCVVCVRRVRTGLPVTRDPEEPTEKRVG